VVTLKFCTHTYLVGLDHELPTDPRLANDGTTPVVGCNHLVCSSCGAVVKHADGRSRGSHYPPGDIESALYESSDPASSPYLDNKAVDAQSRVYFCRCDWADVNIGGVKSIGSIEAMWSCGGHGDDVNAAPTRSVSPSLPLPPSAVAPPKLTLLVSPPQSVAPSQASPAPAPTLVAVAAAPDAPKIKLKYARLVNPEFATASQLRDCLLASYPSAAFFGAPLVGGAHWDDTLPAWGWVVDLIRMRSDWWRPLGIAVEHATRDDDMARRALADFCAGFTESIVLLPWTKNIAASWPDVVASSSGTGWGSADKRLASIIRDQEKYVADIQSPDVFLDGYGKGGKPIKARLTNEDELRTLLADSARAGRFHQAGTVGPWSWLGFEIIRRGEWMWDALVHVTATMDHANEHVVCAALDWFSEQRDLWRFQNVLAGWHAKPPAWSTTPVTTKPKAWQRKMRVLTWHEPQTLGDVARQALWRAVQQHNTPPVVDLP
jgi:hypothetical protein